MMYSAYKFNKQGDNIQPWRTPFPIWNQSVVPCLLLTIASWPVYRFLKRQVRSFFHLLKNFPVYCDPHSQRLRVINKTEVDAFLELSCFFNDLKDVGNLISGSVPFLNPAWTSGIPWFMYCWNLASRILRITLLTCKMSAMCGSLNILWDWDEDWLFQSYGHCWVFQICWHIECGTFTASSLRIWNSSTGIPSPPLALFLVMLPKDHLTLHSRMSGSSWVITPSWLSGSWDLFCTVLLCILATS